MGVRLIQVDAFTEVAFRGNPAAVCFLDAAGDEKWMQNVALEMNLSETAFLLREADGFRLRWFTPTVEVALCGHATLASAHALWEEGLLRAQDTARFYTRSGILTASLRGRLIEMDFPAKPEELAEPPPGLEAALGEKLLYVGRNAFDYIALLESESVLRSLRPDFRSLRGLGVRGVIVTARSESTEFDFVSRFFAPGSGIDEDPVTGSAHCCLGPFWQKRMGKDVFKAYQASDRGGIVHVRVAPGGRVVLGGQAVTVMRGDIVC